VAQSTLYAVRDLAPLIAKYADEAERERRLARPVVDALVDAGVFRHLVPPALGGAAASPMEFCEIIEAVSTIDGSTGWCVMIGGGYGHFSGLLPPPAAAEIFGEPGAIVAGTFRPNGVAWPVAGDYQVNGQWPLASGSSHATWLVGGCRIFDGDQPQLTPTGRPLTRLMFLPVSAATILDTWHTAGLRGTASNDFLVRDLVVPTHRTCWFTHAPVRLEPQYRLPAIAFFAACIASVPWESPGTPSGSFRRWLGQKHRPVRLRGCRSITPSRRYPSPGRAGQPPRSSSASRKYAAPPFSHRAGSAPDRSLRR
jgi:hypothetical protein